MRISITTPHKKYSVIVEPNAFKKFTFPKDVIVVTDSIVRRKYASLLKKHRVVSFTAGEQSKHLTVVEKLSQQLVKLGAQRSTSIIAFGGGVVGDVAGFLAAIYMRGIPVYQVPTSLLAMVDASVGGKTGVDLASGKNLLGAFHQPEAVIIDPQFLLKLPNDEFRNGMGEVVKHGVLDASLFTWLQRNADNINSRDIKTLTAMVGKNVKIKANIVQADERELGQRMLLNLGHTFAHAVEQLSGYSIPHGEAVAMGLMYAAHYSGWPTKSPKHLKQLQHLQQLLHIFSLPTHLETPYTAKQMMRVMSRDKKNTTRGITLVLPNAIGDVQIKGNISNAAIERFITQYHGEIT